MLAMDATRRMAPSYAAAAGGASGRALRVALRESGLAPLADAPPLEVQRAADAPPRVELSTPIEGDSLLARAVPGDPIEGFSAFLDGIQRSVVRAHVGHVPLVHGAVAAAIRIRQSRRLAAWQPAIRQHACYLPERALPPAIVAALRARCEVVDTLQDLDRDAPAPLHPADFTAKALTAVQRSREAAEGELAERWVREGQGQLLMDGGISGREAVARSAQVVGAVKSHRTLYAAGDAVGTVLGLREGERSTAMVLHSPRRTPVATWYLRLRNASGRGPLAGLLRVEVALPDGDGITARADLVSRWLLAERRPVSLPDARWDVMVYGIKECEDYLSAIL